MIRVYNPTDKPQLLELVKLNTPKYFDASEFSGFDNYLENEIEDYFVVEKGEKVVGSGGINYEDDFKRAIISWDVIHPEYHGKGMGRELTEFRIMHIKTVPSVKRVIVRTSQHTDKFYEKMGFELIEIKKDYWAPGFDLYHMEMKL